MDLQIDDRSVVAFDLDDTLYEEIEYVRSALMHVEKELTSRFGVELEKSLFSGFEAGDPDPVGTACRTLGLAPSVKQTLVESLRAHPPAIAPAAGAVALLEVLEKRAIPRALITDGRSMTQRLKLASLGIERHFSCIVISEELGSCKPDVRNFRKVTETLKADRYFYIGDNPMKDVSGARSIGWVTIGLHRKPTSIHARLVLDDASPRADHMIESLADLIQIVR